MLKWNVLIQERRAIHLKKSNPNVALGSISSVSALFEYRLFSLVLHKIRNLYESSVKCPRLNLFYSFGLKDTYIQYA